jgi:hypothetical protein
MQPRPAKPVGRGQFLPIAALPIAILPIAICIVTGGWGGGTVSGAELPPPADRRVDFEGDIQPLLRTRCFSCHGAEKQEAGLRLDQQRRALAGGDRGEVIRPGKSAASRLVLVVAGLDEEIGQMPPDGEGTPLTAEEVGMLRAWIDQGAVWSGDDAATAQEHWSFQPIARTVPPVSAQGQAWIENPIDAFVLERLQREGIAPSPAADRATLIRRVYLDVLGLLPSPAEVSAFVNDARPNAYELLVERVLSSPHYGERFGRHWLDLARYADSDGYEKDRARPFAWRYRQWVIEALNADMPFDQFSTWQIAGDLIPQADMAGQVASGFHRNTLHNTEGGIDPEEDRVKKTVDRTNTVSTIWLGLTMGCAQCHSHKYDPITQREYYSLFAFFNYLDEVDVPAPLNLEQREYEAARQKFAAAHAIVEQHLADYEKSRLANAQQEWETTALETSCRWQPLLPDQRNSRHGAELSLDSSGVIDVGGPNLLSDVYRLSGMVSDQRVTSLRLEVLPDAERLPQAGPGRANNGNFVLTTLRVWTRSPAAAADAPLEPVRVVAGTADFSQQDWEVSQAVNENPRDGWAVSPQFGQRHVAVFRLETPIPAGQPLVIELDQTYDQTEPHNLGRFRLSCTTFQGEATLDGLPAAVVAALETPRERRSTQQTAAIADYYRTIDAERLRLQAQVEQHAKQAPPPPPTQAQAVSEIPHSKRTTHLLIRGEFLDKGPQVSAGTPEILPPFQPRSEVPDRRDLAHWLTDAKNPLTARVTVNRIWQRYFARGLVRSSDDFGTQGEKPTHPQLLDWLAGQLRDEGWSLKHVHRLILTSATYRQQSRPRLELQQRDPENALLARQSRRRVEAEVVRDVALSAAGLLDARIGGPSVRPPQPAEYSQLTYANSARWESSRGGDAHRRGLYTFFQRTSPYPMLLTFDAPDSTECTVRRSRSNTPLQALTLWNDSVFFECAQGLARRIVEECPSSGDVEADRLARLDHGVAICLGRRLDDRERQILTGVLQQQIELSRQRPDQIKSIVGAAPLPDGLDPTELSGWVAVSRVLLNVDEFIMRD